MAETAATADNLYAGGINFSSSTNGSGAGTLLFDLPLSTVASFNDRAMQFTSSNSTLNKGFVQSVIDTSQRNVSSASRSAFGFMNSGIGTIRAGNAHLGDQLMALNVMNQEYSLKRASSAPRAQTSGMCFITTAICALENKPDDCPELVVLRAFRDDVMLKHPEWSQLVADYYRLAPAIVKRIRNMPDGGREFFMRLNVQYLKPSIRAVLAGDYSEAVRIYSKMVRIADKLTGGQNG